MTEPRTVSVPRDMYVNYLKRAEECLSVMGYARNQNRYEACVINAIQAVISAADALCVFRLGLRHKGDKHEDAIELFRTINIDDTQIQDNASRLAKILHIKSAAQYGERSISQTAAEQASKDAERLVEFVRSEIKKTGIR